jgi:hypothetical protein
VVVVVVAKPGGSSRVGLVSGALLASAGFAWPADQQVGDRCSCVWYGECKLSII